MQLSNIDLEEWGGSRLIPHRILEVSSNYGIESPEIPLFLKYLASTSETFISTIAAFFELSTLWLTGESDRVTEPIENPTAFQELIKFLVYSKQQGWKPKIIFVNSRSLDSSLPPILLIELLKITKIGIGSTVYKQWDSDDWEETLLLCQRVGLHYRGFQIDSNQYQLLTQRRILPINALKNALNLWFPEVNTTNYPEGASILKEEKKLIEELCCTSLNPTFLY